MKASLGWRYRLMIAILAFTAYAPTLRTGFLWDDHVVIEANPGLRSWSFQALQHDFTHDVFNGQGDPYYRPLTSVVNRVDHTLWGLRPAGFHLTNLLFHIGNALLIAELVLALSFAPLIAFLTASLFAVHPIGVEQLLIVAGRAELMGLFFPLLSILLLLKKSRWAAAAGTIAFIAGLLSKESAVVTPFWLALVYILRHEPRNRYVRLGPLFLLLLPYIALRQSVVGPLLPHPDPELTARFFFQDFPSVILRYGGLLLFPWNLHSHRLLLHISPFWLVYLLGSAGACAYLYKKYGRPAVFCIGWFVLALLPKTPAMIFGGFMLDHWAYPALLAVVLPLAGLVYHGWHSSKERLRAGTALVYFSVLIGWSLLVHLNVALRGTDEKMYRWALYFTTSHPVKYNLGVLLLQTGRAPEAIDYFTDVLSVYPEDPKATRALSLAYWTSGHPGAAVRLLQDFDANYPGDSRVRAQLSDMKKRRPLLSKTP